MGISLSIKFYENLYKTQETDCILASAFLESVDRRLSEESVNILEQEITLDELTKTVRMI